MNSHLIGDVVYLAMKQTTLQIHRTDGRTTRHSCTSIGFFCCDCRQKQGVWLLLFLFCHFNPVHLPVFTTKTNGFSVYACFSIIQYTKLNNMFHLSLSRQLDFTYIIFVVRVLTCPVWFISILVDRHLRMHSDDGK